MNKALQAPLKQKSAPGASTRSFAGRSDIPLVSILTVCRNAAPRIRNCIESILSQDYPRIEYIVQDGNSTDETLSILAEYGDKIKVQSKVDTPNKANYWGIERCSGDILGMCWSDEELLPGAVSWGVEQLLSRPGAGGLFGDVLSIDENGVTYPYQKPNTLQWDIKKYLCWEILPNYCSSFFRRSALQSSGFFDFDIENHCCMYDYYAKVGIHHPIYYVPGFVAKFGRHKDQLSSGSGMLQFLVKTIQNSFEALVKVPNTPAWVKEIEPSMKAGIRLAMLDSMINTAGDVDNGTRLIYEAMQYAPDKQQIKRVFPQVLQTLLEHERYQVVADICEIMEKNGLSSEEVELPKAQVYYKLGRYHEASICIQNAIKINPFDPTAQMMFVEIQEDLRTIAKSKLEEKIETCICPEEIVPPYIENSNFFNQRKQI
jgi:hypothetical protein